MKTTTLYVEGMHCNSCKILVENSLIQLPNIQAVDVNIHKGEVWIQYENNLNLDEITSLIRKNGYKIVDKPVIRPWLSKNIKDYKIAIISLISFFVLYMLLQHT
jgi:copper chaperone CopZ